jgi:hypothetical protein
MEEIPGFIVYAVFLHCPTNVILKNFSVRGQEALRGIEESGFRSRLRVNWLAYNFSSTSLSLHVVPATFPFSA